MDDLPDTLMRRKLHYVAPLARRDSWLQTIEVYDDYAESPYERMAQVIKHLGLQNETIGFEKSYLIPIPLEAVVKGSWFDRLTTNGKRTRSS